MANLEIQSGGSASRRIFYALEPLLVTYAQARSVCKRIATGEAKIRWILIRCFIGLFVCTLFCVWRTIPVPLPPLVASHGRMLESSPPDTPALPKYAAVYTPFEFSPGGGEKVTLYAIKVLQSLGYHVTFFLRHHGCSSSSCIQHTAEILVVRGIDFNLLEIVKIDPYQAEERYIHYKAAEFEVYWSIGITKIPAIFGLGRHLNLYTCQFPYDIKSPISEEDLSILSSYQTILSYSNFAQLWTKKLLSSSFQTLTASNLSIPSLQVLFPPTIERSVSPEDMVTFSALKFQDQELHIAMLGIFFLGRQNKGHRYGIRAMKSLLVKTEVPIRLHLMGAVQPGHEGHLENLRKESEGLPITFHIGASSAEVATILKKSLLFWHMTGVDQPSDDTADPASLEHFGISIVEAMWYGCIPIVLNRGGPVEIVEHGKSGFVAPSVDGFVQYSLSILSHIHPSPTSHNITVSPSPPGDRESIASIQMSAMNSTSKFLISKFESSLSEIILKGTRHM